METAQETPKLEGEEKTQPIPIGFTAKAEGTALVTFQQLFDLLRMMENLVKVVHTVKSDNFNNGNIKYYFKEDLEEVKDEQGNIIMVENTLTKELVPQLRLRADFWS